MGKSSHRWLRVPDGADDIRFRVTAADDGRYNGETDIFGKHGNI